MEREQYAVMARREDDHWWYAGMRRVALSVLDQALADDGTAVASGDSTDAGGAWTDAARGSTEAAHGPTDAADGPGRPAPQRRLLDAGCGTGGTTVRLGRFGRVVGVDLAWEALGPAAGRARHSRPPLELVRGSIERLPFADASFDAVTSFEVVYHLGVANDQRALAELRRVLQPGGLLLLRVPAHDWLRGAHDRLVHTRHRYAPAEVRTKLEQAGFHVERLTWANSVLFAPAVAKRLLERVTEPRPGTRTGGPSADAADATEAAAEPDLWQPPPLLNALLEALVAAEAHALRRGFSLPFGLSVLAVARAV